MLKQKRGSRGQSLSEYVLLIAIVTAALIGMQTYMKRGVQGVVRLAADDIGGQRKGSIVEGMQGEIRTLSPKLDSQRRVITETNVTAEITTRNTSRIDRIKNETTTLEKTDQGYQKPQLLNHEYVYHNETLEEIGQGGNQHEE